MNVTYGADYSRHELSPAELGAFTVYRTQFLLRYIGYPDNPKCITHYPGAYQRHVHAGRTVLLVIENDGTDPQGGHDGGVAMARRAHGRVPRQPADLLQRGWLAANPERLGAHRDGLSGRRGLGSGQGAHRRV